MRRKSVQSPIRSSLLASAILSMALVGSAVAADDAASYAFDMADQTLTQALKTYAQTTNQEIIYSEDLVTGRSAPALKGAYTADAALRELLKGTGLMAERSPSGALMIKRPPPNSPTVGASETDESTGEARLMRLAQADSAEASGAASTRAEMDKLDEVVVAAEQLRQTFRANNASSATLLSADLRTLPLNIAVIQADLIRSQGIATPAEAVTRIGSVYDAGSHAGRSYNRFFGRGFMIDGERSGYLKNGIPVYGIEAPAGDLAHVDRLEYLRGASALLYGAGQPGGVINYVYKQPQAEAAYAFEFTAGEFNTYRAMMDATGSLGTDKALYRFSLGWEDSEGWQDFDYTKRFAPALQFALTPAEGTKISLLAELTRNENNPSNSDSFAVDGRPLRFPDHFYFGQANDFDEQEGESVQVTLEQQLRGGWSLLLQGGANSSFRNGGVTGYFGYYHDAYPADGRLIRDAFAAHRAADGRYAAAHATWKGELAGAEHNFLIGGNWSQVDMENNSIYWYDGFPVYPTMPVPVLDLENPTYADYAYPRNFRSSPPFFIDEWEYGNQGLNIQDLIHIPSLRAHLLVGGRYARYEFDIGRVLDYDGSEALGNRRNALTNERFIPRAGVVVDLSETTNVFASYSESFVGPVSTRRDSAGNPITVPEIGEQYEAGLRQLLLDERISISLAAYQLTKQNVIVPTSTFNVYSVDGEQRSRGLEFDLTGAILPRWNAYLSYAYTDTEVVSNGTGTSGRSFAGAPRNRLTAWTAYEVGGGLFDGLLLGVGVDASSRSPGNAAHSFFIPGHFVWDALVGYRWNSGGHRWRAQLNVKNLTDEYYYRTTDDVDHIKRGSPRQFLLTAGLEF
jgi:iron complex outermembrane receptor protein